MLLQPRTLQALGHGGKKHQILIGRSTSLHASVDGLLLGRAPLSVRMAASSSSSATTSAQPQQQSVSSSPRDVETLIAYHNRTKHNFNKYADGPHGLDWANQPNPFRRYKGSKVVPLRHFPPIPENPSDRPYGRAFLDLHDPCPLSADSISQLLYDSFALSAWKTTGFSTWSLRVNPSSGNLHPTEAYIVCGPVAGISEVPFVAHYTPKEHAIEVRAAVPLDIWNELKEGFPPDTLFVGLTSIYWREAWKYGERAFRYCNHDVGHALGTVSMAGVALGWDSVLLDGWSTGHIDHLLGVAGRKSVPHGSPKRGCYPELEQEHADCLVAIFPGKSQAVGSKGNLPVQLSSVIVPPEGLASSLPSKMSDVKWEGKPNMLSKEHLWWDVIDKASAASRKPTLQTELRTRPLLEPWPSCHHYKPLTLRQVIHKRRSAVDMDGKFVLDKEAFYQILCKAMPSNRSSLVQGEGQQLPFRVLPWKSEVHMAIFVHRVSGLPKGLYFLIRNSEHEWHLREALRSEFHWEKPENCPETLPFYRLVGGDCEKLAMQLSCFQDIAGSGCFSLGMIARVEALNETGAWMYPRLFWESGLLGQLLYLEAHGLGISATGIGCYFDDPVHKILGLKGSEFQSFYHFTVGAPVTDRRIMSLPPYPGPDLDG